MPELPVLTSRKLVKALTTLGFVNIRQRGSHLVMKRGNLLIIVPMHKGDIPPGTLKSILRQGSINLQDLINILK